MLVREISTSFDLIILFKLCFLFTMNAWLKTTRILNGSTLSIVSISLENRLTIRPRGVVSNISIAHRKLECKSAICRTCEHWRPPNETVSDEKKVVPTEFSISMFGFSSFFFLGLCWDSNSWEFRHCFWRLDIVLAGEGLQKAHKMQLIIHFYLK